jgi:hypothetical protein
VNCTRNTVPNGNQARLLERDLRRDRRGAARSVTAPATLVAPPAASCPARGVERREDRLRELHAHAVARRHDRGDLGGAVSRPSSRLTVRVVPDAFAHHTGVVGDGTHREIRLAQQEEAFERSAGLQVGGEGCVAVAVE